MEEVINYLTNPHLFPQILFIVLQIVRFLFIVISIIFALALIFLLTRNRYVENRVVNDWKEFLKERPYQKVKMIKDWERIIKQVKEGDESDKKLAIIEADDIVNDMLEKMGYKDEKLEDKLSKVDKDIIPNVEDLKKAHKKRRDIVYDPGYTLSDEETDEVIAIYEKTFKDLQFL